MKKWQEYTNDLRKEECHVAAARVFEDRMPEERTTKDVFDLCEWAKACHPSTFKLFSDEALKDVMKHMDLTTLNDKQLLFAEKDFGVHFCIVFTGKIVIFAGMPAESYELLKENREEELKSRDVTTSGFLGEAVHTFYKGGCFGEVALIGRRRSVTSTMQRSASAVASGTTQVLMIHRDIYQRSFLQFDAKASARADKLKMLQSAPLFKQWSRSKLISLVNRLTQKKYRYGDVIAKQGTCATEVLFVFAGEMRVVGPPVASTKNKEQEMKVFFAKKNRAAPKGKHSEAPTISSPLVKTLARYSSKASGKGEELIQNVASAVQKRAKERRKLNGGMAITGVVSSGGGGNEEEGGASAAAAYGTKLVGMMKEPSVQLALLGKGDVVGGVSTVQ
jgi:CRP-like cAMP-binding protein